MEHTRKLKFSFLPGLVFSMVFSPVAWSQGIEKVVVTAQRRAESLQDVPVAVSAFSDEQAAKIGITEMLDIARIVPNFIGHNNAGLGTANTYSLRGLNNTESIATFDPPVGTYVDDFFIQRQNANNYSLFDIDRVEVVRGPQGTLFGRNTTGGAVRVILKDPGEEFGGFVEAGGGSYDRVNIRGSVDVPVSDIFLTKLSGYYMDDSGFVESKVTGEDNINAEKNRGVRGAFQWKVTNNITWDASITYIKNDHANLLNEEIDNDRFSGTGLTRDGMPFANILVGDKKDFGLGDEVESVHFTSDIEWETELGTVNILTSYLELDQNFLLDFFGTLGLAALAQPTGLFTIANEGEHNQISQEFKISGSTANDRLDYVAGFFYFNEDNKTDFAFYNFFALFSGRSPVEYDRIIDNGVDSWAIYAQADWQFTEQLTFTAGFRYTDEEKDFGVTDNGNPRSQSSFGNAELMALNIPLEQSTSVVTPRFAIEYRHNDDFMIYGSATRGFKSGGWNARGLGAGSLIPFSPEKIWNYEGGIRSEWFDNKFRVNLTGFYSDISDFQLPSAYTDPVTGSITFITQNFADLKVYGFEAEILTNPVENLTVFANIGILETEYKNLDPAIVLQQFQCQNGITTTGRPGSPCAQGIVNSTGGIAPPVRSPEHQIAVGAWYEFPIMANLKVVPSINVTNYGDHNISTSGQDSALLSGYTLMNSSISLLDETAGWSVTLSCKNCTDQEYYVSYLAGTRYLGDPMTWAVNVNKRF